MRSSHFSEALPIQLYYGVHGSVSQQRRGLTDYPLELFGTSIDNSRPPSVGEVQIESWYNGDAKI